MKDAGLYIDHIGFLVWLFLLYVFYKDLNNKKIKTKWPRYIVLIIAVLGILIDGYLLIKFYLVSTISEKALSYDYFGLPVFIYLIGLSIYDLKNKIGPKFLKILFLLIAIGGLIADGGMILGIF